MEDNQDKLELLISLTKSKSEARRINILTENISKKEFDKFIEKLKELKERKENEIYS